MEVRRHLDAIRGWLVKRDEPWIAGWVIELDHGIHVHVLLYLPEAPAVREDFGRWLMRRFNMPMETGRSAIWVLRKNGTGQSVHLGAVNPNRCYNGRFGLDGLIEYVGKSLLRGCRRASRGIPVGRQVGFSAVVRRLVADSAGIEGSCRRV
ncbi:MAG: hypothetical protein RIC85_05110 [Gammaproteobacteria bacterium]